MKNIQFRFITFDLINEQSAEYSTDVCNKDRIEIDDTVSWKMFLLTFVNNMF